MLATGDAANFLGVSFPTLRRWDASAKLRAGRHPHSGYRVYREADALGLRKQIQASTMAA